MDTPCAAFQSKLSPDLIEITDSFPHDALPLALRLSARQHFETDLGIE
jgi:hypothetical protein